MGLGGYTVRVSAEQDDAPVRGNAMASGDSALDRRVEDQILARLDDGDVWAWASVTVEVRWMGLVAREYLGCCSYRDEAEFRADGYYSDMVRACLSDLDAQRRAIVEASEVA